MNGKSDSLVGLKRTSSSVSSSRPAPACRANDVIVEPAAEALANSNYSVTGDGSVSKDFLDALGAIDFGMNCASNPVRDRLGPRPWRDGPGLSLALERAGDVSRRCISSASCDGRRPTSSCLES